ncbi:TetR/AcrR family transcriptional regulator [Adlercreutzia muris]|uniref:TetR/AcrR family transcriptional regulator n=1 Tax=Adlercreutzia muris TaxID=1796610 RepID=UPI0035168F40
MTTREKILDVAYRSFADKGYNRTSMGSIAEELGITRPALYYHFASKEDLLLATYKMVDPLVDVNVDDVLASTSVEQYRRELDALIAHITGNLRDDERRNRFVATVESASSQIPAVLQSARAQYDATCAIFKAAIEHGRGIGALPAKLDADTAKQYLSAYIYGVGDILLRGSKIDIDATRNMVIEGLFNEG